MGGALLLLPLSGCRREPAVGTIYFGPVCGDSSAARPPDVRRSSVPDSTLRPGFGRIVFVVDSSLGNVPLREVQVTLVGTTRGGITDSLGVTQLDAPGGPHEFRVRRIMYSPQRVFAEVRAGFRDTVRTGIGVSPACVFAAGGAPAGIGLVRRHGVSDDQTDGFPAPPAI